MEFIADGLLIAGAFTATLYCWVLSRRLNALKSMDQGLGGAIAGLSARVEQTRASLADTKATTGDITKELSALTARAEIAAGRLELLLATVHENQDPAPREDKDREKTREIARPSTVRASKPERKTESDLVSALKRIAATGSDR